MKKVSKWQSGKPPCDGIWQIKNIDDEVYYARFKDGLWAGGYYLIKQVEHAYRFKPYDHNNDPNHKIKWRGLL